MADFFDEKRAAAIFKHAVLNSYVDPFTMKVGSTAANGRVAFIDGYAGEGRYDDGGEGSPALLLRKAKGFAGRRQLEWYLVEQSAARLAALQSVVDAEVRTSSSSCFLVTLLSTSTLCSRAPPTCRCSYFSTRSVSWSRSHPCPRC